MKIPVFKVAAQNLPSVAERAEERFETMFVSLHQVSNHFEPIKLLGCAEDVLQNV